MKILGKGAASAGVKGSLPRTLKPNKRRYKPALISEAALHAQCESYLEWVHLEKLHIPSWLLSKAFQHFSATGAELGAMRDCQARLGTIVCRTFEEFRAAVDAWRIGA